MRSVESFNKRLCTSPPDGFAVDVKKTRNNDEIAGIFKEKSESIRSVSPLAQGDGFLDLKEIIFKAPASSSSDSSICSNGREASDFDDSGSECSLNDYKALNIDGLVGELEGEGAGRGSDDDEDVEGDQVENNPEKDMKDDTMVPRLTLEELILRECFMSQAQILKAIENRPEKSDTPLTVDQLVGNAELLMRNLIKEDREKHNKEVRDRLSKIAMKEEMKRDFHGSPTTEADAVEADAVLIKEFEMIYRKLDRLANMTLADRKDRINFNLLHEKERKIVKLLGYEKSQKLRLDFYNKRMLRGTKECSEESDLEFQESPATIINSEIIEKFVEVPGRIQTPEDMSVSWTISKRRFSPERTRGKAKK